MTLDRAWVFVLLIPVLGCAAASAAQPSDAPFPRAIDRSASSNSVAVPQVVVASGETSTQSASKSHGLVAKELRRWSAPGAGQGVAVDEHSFYGIGNTQIRKYDKRTGERLSEWNDTKGGALVHLNSGYVEDGVLVLAHSNFPHLPMASSLESFDATHLQPLRSHSFGIQHGSLTWATRKDGFWWACFANYNDRGTTPGLDNRWTYFGKFNDQWQLIESWIFPPELIAAFGRSSSSGGSWGDDGELYITGHDAEELYVLRLPKMGSTLQWITTISVPFAGQAWAWDRSAGRVIYGISRKAGEVIVCQVPELPASLRNR